MKQEWKTVLVTAVIALLVAALCLVGWKNFAVDTNAKVINADMSIKERIEQYKLISEEQRYITEIWTLRYEAALMQAKFNPVQDVNVPAPPR